MTTIEEYLIRRKDLKPYFYMQSKYIAAEDVFLFKAVIETRFEGAWSTSIALAITSLTTVLTSAGEIE